MIKQHRFPGRRGSQLSTEPVATVSFFLAGIVKADCSALTGHRSRRIATLNDLK